MSRRTMSCACAPARALLLLSLLNGGCSSPSTPTPTPTTTSTTTTTTATTVPPTTTTIPATAPLTISCPANVTTVSFTGAAVSVTFPSPTTTGGVSPVVVGCNRISGSPFPIGATPVLCTANDAVLVTRTCTFTVTVTAQTERLNRTRFLAFGDSLTAGEVAAPTTTPSREGEPNYRLVVVPSASYPTVLATMLRARYGSQASAIEVINAGLSGEWAEDGAIRLPGVLTTNRPEAVLLLEGINDIPNPNGVTTGSRAIETMAQLVRGRGARLFLATLPPSRPGLRSIPNSVIMSFNSRVRATAVSQGAVLVDVYPVFEADVNRYIGIDGLHPTEAGYQKLAELFFDAIRSDLEAR